jgi:hypothetical protein
MTPAAIDAAAREMTRGQPPADLRARVLAQLEDRREGLGRWLLARAAVVTLSAIAAGLGVRALTRPPQSLPAPARAAIVHHLAPAPPAIARLDVDDRRVTRVTTPSVAAPGPSPAVLAWRARAIQALAPVDALDVAAIQPAALDLTQLEVKPLATSTLRVPPIDEGPPR